MTRLALALIVIAALPLHANAAAFCSGTVIRAITYDNGRVTINGSWRGSFTDICRLTETWKGIDPQTCWAWFAQVNSAITAGKPVIVYYPGLDQSECATVPTYESAPAPGYVLLDNL